jgi:hypothetical protein
MHVINYRNSRLATLPVKTSLVFSSQTTQDASSHVLHCQLIAASSITVAVGSNCQEMFK